MPVRNLTVLPERLGWFIIAAHLVQHGQEELPGDDCSSGLSEHYPEVYLEAAPQQTTKCDRDGHCWIRAAWWAAAYYAEMTGVLQESCHAVMFHRHELVDAIPSSILYSMQSHKHCEDC